MMRRRVFEQHDQNLVQNNSLGNSFQSIRNSLVEAT
jgi:hypothetical protein